MSEIARFDPAALRPARPRPAATRAEALPAPKGYRGAGDVGRRAGVLNEVETPENLTSLKRLGRALGSNQPLRGDVPRGFYLNLRV